MPGQPTQNVLKDFFPPRTNTPQPGRTEQPSERKEEGQPRRNHQGYMSIQVSNNRHLDTKAEICQNRPKHSVTQASYYGNDVAGGSMKIGGMNH